MQHVDSIQQDLIGSLNVTNWLILFSCPHDLDYINRRKNHFRGQEMHSNKLSFFFTITFTDKLCTKRPDNGFIKNVNKVHCDFMLTL